MKEEIWKDVIGYEGLYQVSNFGIIKSLGNKFKRKEKILKPWIAKGYKYVDLWKDKIHVKYQVHQLVAETFLGHIRCGFKLVINHKDFNTLNNYIENLEIVTHRENTSRKHIVHSSQYTGVFWHKKTEKWASQIQINGKYKYLGLFINEYDAHMAYENELNTLQK